MKAAKHIKYAACFLSLLFAAGCTQATGMVVEDSSVSVITTAVTPGEIKNQVTYAGQITASESINVMGKMAGRVEAYYFDVGDRVQSGDVLYTLEKKDVEDQLRQLEASLRTASASVNSAQISLRNVTGGQLESSISQMETAIETAEQAVAVAEMGIANAELALANTQLQYNDIEKSYNDTKTLYESGIVSKSQMDAAELGYNQAASALQQAQIQLEQAQIQYDQAVLGQKQSIDTYEISTGSVLNDSRALAASSVSSAAAQRDAIAVQLDIARSTLDDLDVTSPIEGVITSRNVEAGEFSTSGYAAYVVENIDTVHVDVKVSEFIINNIRSGLKVDVIVPTLGEDPVVGTVKTVSPSADATNMYPVKIEIDNREGLLKPGMFTEVKFVKEENTNTIVVHRDAVLQDETGLYVYLNQGGRAQRTPVETGIDNGLEIEILSGLSTGDEVVTTGQSNLIDGDLLNIVSASGGSSSSGQSSDQPESSTPEEE